MTLRLENIQLNDGSSELITNLNATFSRGINVLVGSTLSGKTTTMRLIAGLVKPTSGLISLDSKDLTKVEVRDRSVSFVYQQFINYPSFTVFENIASPLRVAKIKQSKQEIKERVEEMASMLGISQFLDRKPSELSGGQQQRVAIARALARKSDIVLLDEPLANLDYKLREQLRDELHSIFDNSDSVVIYSTAEPDEALYFSAPTYVLHEGQLQQNDLPLEIYNRPENLFTARALSDPPLNLLEGRSVDGLLEFAGISVKGKSVLANGEFLFGVRPHNLHAVAQASDTAELTGEVQLAEVTGSFTFVHIKLKPGEEIVVELEGAHSINPGENFTAYFDPASLYGFDPNSSQTVLFPGKEVVA
jgi:glycerol transport system ATP-binding protein